MNQTNASPLEIVNQRMKLYNEHKLESFLKLYSPEIKIYTYPDKLLGQGLAHLRHLFEPMFQEKSVQVRINYQIVSDSFVINEEIVTYGQKSTRYVSIYEVKDNKIQSVRFVRDSVSA